MNKNTILHTLQSGICEITYTDEYSVEFTMIGTLSQTHFPADIDTMDVLDDSDTFVVFNVPKEKWQTLSAQYVIDIEQLTGEGADANKDKLQASPEYMQQLNLFNDTDDMDSDVDFFDGSEGNTQ